MQSVAKKIDCIFCGNLRHLSRFAMVGALNTLIDFLVFTVFHEVVGAISFLWLLILLALCQ